MTLDVYSTRDQEGRSKIVLVVYIKTFVEGWSLTSTTAIEMVATRRWGDGTGGLLGCSIRFCMFDAANDVVWHILVSRAGIKRCVVPLLFMDANVALNVPKLWHRMLLMDRQQRQQDFARTLTMLLEHLMVS